MTEPGSASASLRVLALGDSYTIGEQVDPDQRWPVQFARLCAADGLPMAEPVIVARTGWTTDELEGALDAADASSIRPPYDLVSLLIGVNDQYRGRATDQFEPAFCRLLQRAVGYAGGDARRAVVLSIPDWGITPFAAAEGREPRAVAKAIDAYNDLSRRHCQTLGVHYVPITDLTRQAQSRADLLTADGLHPSGVDYARWATRVQQHLNKAGWPHCL